ncbi:beta-xylosidase [Belliella baltica DSM 15883]|uniref:Beta-xylosidase n=1 Tax=Belliella baltica (strain DSM 15883 / CIP 108006 / LMG 21964 / BA134) TaxID=866536 RepID=I3Z983_BELBD|nr:glycoside hydrolase family 43 protein [Belliella baltica]AFL85801.1 beta-xylosidase [Belliella baltica DSM 15883]
MKVLKIAQSGFYLLGILFMVTGCFSSNSKNEIADRDELVPSQQQLFYADPTIFFHQGIYYLYGTVENKPNKGFEVYTSYDLVNWDGPSGANDGFALRREDVFGNKGFWAPQVFEHNGKFHMAYTANENIAIATSSSPLGPFVQENKVAIEAPVKQIDPFVFFDDDGKVYMYFVRLTDGNRLFVAEMKPDLSGILEHTAKECISAEEEWENTQQVNWPVAEGPTIIKHNGLYYFIYSTNDFRNPDYAVGYAVSDNPIGPWEKVPQNPILNRMHVGENGTGHGDLFKDGNGDWHYVLHTHYSSTTPNPRKTAIIKVAFKESEQMNTYDEIVFDYKSFRFLFED